MKWNERQTKSEHQTVVYRHAPLSFSVLYWKCTNLQIMSFIWSQANNLKLYKWKDLASYLVAPGHSSGDRILPPPFSIMNAGRGFLYTMLHLQLSLFNIKSCYCKNDLSDCSITYIIKALYCTVSGNRKETALKESWKIGMRAPSGIGVFNYFLKYAVWNGQRN